MQKQIYLPPKDKKRLERDFKVTKATVWAALNYTTQSSLANMLRRVALERGGVEYPAVAAKANTKPAAGPITSVAKSAQQHDAEFNIDCETTFDTAANKMIQVFSPRVRLTVDLATGEVGVYIDNELKTTADNPTIPELMHIQMDVQKIANQLKA